MAWTTPASAAVVAPLRACNSTTVRALSARHKSRAKSLCRVCPEASEIGLCRVGPSGRAAGLSPLDAGRHKSYINYRIMSHESPSVLERLPWRRAAPPARPLDPARGSVSCARHAPGSCSNWMDRRIAVAANADEVLSTGHRCAKRTAPICRNVEQRDTGFDQYLDGSAEIQPPARAGKPLDKPGDSRTRLVSTSSIRKANLVLC